MLTTLYMHISLNAQGVKEGAIKVYNPLDYLCESTDGLHFLYSLPLSYLVITSGCTPYAVVADLVISSSFMLFCYV